MARGRRKSTNKEGNHEAGSSAGAAVMGVVAMALGAVVVAALLGLGARQVIASLPWNR